MKQHHVALVIVAFMAASFIGCAHNRAREKSMQTEIAFNTGAAYLQKGEFDTALPYFLRVEELKPGQPQVHNAIGLVYLGQGKTQAAIDEFQKALKKNGDPDYHNNLAHAYLLAGNYQQAISECDKAIDDSAYRTPSFAYFNKAMALLKMNREAESMAALKEACKHDPNGDRPFYELALLQMKQGSIGEAIDNLRMAKKNNAQYPDAYYQLAVAYLQHGDRRAACKELADLIAICPAESSMRAQAQALSMKSCEGN